MTIIKIHKHISDNTEISKVKQSFGGGGECHHKGAAQGNSLAVMEQLCTLTGSFTKYTR